MAEQRSDGGKGVDKREFMNDLRMIKRNCLRTQGYSPENDISYLVAKHGLSWVIIWKKIQELLSV